ncbi:hypothetical protein ACP4OV_007785 [Aristida adscensionis]
MQALSRAARGLAAAAAAAAAGGHRGHVQPARGIMVQVRDGNLEQALSIMERKMRSSGMERLIRRRTDHHVKDSEKRVLARKALMQRVRSQALGKKLREILIKKIRGSVRAYLGRQYIGRSLIAFLCGCSMLKTCPIHSGGVFCIAIMMDLFREQLDNNKTATLSENVLYLP